MLWIWCCKVWKVRARTLFSTFFFNSKLTWITQMSQDWLFETWESDEGYWSDAGWITFRRRYKSVNFAELSLTLTQKGVNRGSLKQQKHCEQAQCESIYSFIYPITTSLSVSESCNVFLKSIETRRSLSVALEDTHTPEFRSFKKCSSAVKHNFPSGIGGKMERHDLTRK